MFTVQSFRNESVTSIQFEKNAVVLIKKSVSATGNTRVDVLTFSGCPDTKETTIVKHLLKGLLAEMNVANDFNGQFATFETGVKINGENEIVKTGIQAKRKFLPFLSTSTIFKTDSNGKLSHAVKCDDGVMLRDTALNIRPEQLVTMYGYNSAQFRSALHHTAQAVLAQTSFYTAVSDEMQEIENGLAELAEQEKKQQQEQAKQQQEQKPKKTGTTGK